MKLVTTRGILLLLVLFGASAVLSTGKTERQSVYRNARLGIEFRFPAGWIHEKCSADYGTGDCIGFKLRPSGKKRPSKDYVMVVELKNMSLEKTAEGEVLFEKVNGEWVKHGRFETVKARQISGGNWRGMYAVADCGISDENGFHAAAGECLTAILSDGSRSVVIETDGMIATDKVLNEVVKSFKFRERGGSGRKAHD